MAAPEFAESDRHAVSGLDGLAAVRDGSSASNVLAHTMGSANDSPIVLTQDSLTVVRDLIHWPIAVDSTSSMQGDNTDAPGEHVAHVIESVREVRITVSASLLGHLIMICRTIDILFSDRGASCTRLAHH